MRTLFTLLLLFICLFAESQTTDIKGTLIDTSGDKTPLNSVVAVLQKKDSVLVAYTRSDDKGNFTIRGVTNGDYIFLVTHPSYAEYVDKISIKEGSSNDLGKIYMIEKAKLMKEIIIRQQVAAIRQKGDTTEYIADSFKVSANASVEDLLKKMPGIQVDKDGKITSQGKTVEKVLVDGEEFFSDDPTVATRNLRADAIDKVQSFDKKSEQAEFTGIDDGQTTRTLNLKMKENKKRGAFGKLTAGAGPDGIFSNEAMINAFKGKRKFAAFGIMSNTGRTGLGWEDKNNYGGGNNFEFDEATGGMYFYNQGDADGFDNESFYGDGVPKSWTGGVHFSNKWLEDKRHLNLNYRYGKINTNAVGSILEQTVTPDTVYYQNNRGEKFSSKMRNKIDGSFEIKLDSFSSIKVTADASISRSESEGITDRSYKNLKGGIINSTLGTNDNVTDTRVVNSNLIYKKRFAKKGRTLSVNFSAKYNSSESDGLVQSSTKYYNGGGTVDSSNLIDQKKIKDNISSSYSARAAFTEPLHKNGYLEANYSINFNNSENTRSTLIKSLNGKYDNEIDSLSNDYVFNVTTNSAGLNYRFSNKKINFSFGTNLARTAFLQNDLELGVKRTLNYTNLFPRANFNYAFTQYKRISFNYNGNSRQPTLDQIQPLRENSDPLNQLVGNPDLDQSFTHNLSVSFNSYKVLNNTYMWANLNYSATDNAISSSYRFSPNGKRESKFINVDGNRSIRGYLNYNTKVKKTNLNVGFNASFGLNKNVSVINDQHNVNDNNDYRFSPNISYRKEKNFEIRLYPTITYTATKSSIRPDVVTNYWSYAYQASTEIQLPFKMEFESDVNYERNPKLAGSGVNTNVIKWNASLNKKILKGDVGLIKLVAYDILDQNIGYSRFSYGNTITEKNYNTLRRYFMLSFTWNFSKNGAKPAGF